MIDETARLRTRYLDLLRDSLIGLTTQDPALGFRPGGGVVPFDPATRHQGRDWPATAQSMIGAQRMFQLQKAVEQVIAQGVPGDLIETGVWRGGACILMRAVLMAHGVKDRRVWVADSFEGLPAPDPERYPADRTSTLHSFEQLAIPLETVRENFRRYRLLDDQVVFLKGWFRDTLKDAPVERLAVLRLDGDLYESTIDALDALYDKLSAGGYVIVDDFAVVEGCRAAVADFRRARGIGDPIYKIDDSGVYWRRGGAT